MFSEEYPGIREIVERGREGGRLPYESPPPSSAFCAVVRQVQEYYAEFCAVNEDFFSANCPDSMQLALPRPPATAKTLLSRNREAVLSVLLALKKKPSAIRYAVSGLKIPGTPQPARRLPLVLVAGVTRYKLRRPGEGHTSNPSAILSWGGGLPASSVAENLLNIDKGGSFLSTLWAELAKTALYCKL